MNKRFHAQRLHIIYSLETLLYQLHTLSFFLSPSIWLYTCRIISQFHCSRPRELDPSRTLRFFYAVLFVFNLPIFWTHSIRGAAEGRAIILDFVGMSYLPSKLQLFSLDLIIIFLQVLLITIAYETSVYYAASDAGAVDMLLPDDIPPFSIPLFQPSLNSPAPSGSLPASPSIPTDSKMTLVANGHDLPLILDLRFNSILNHIRHPRAPPPPPPRTETSIPLPNTAPWPLPSIGMLMRAGRQMRGPLGTGGRAPPPSTRDATGQSQFPGGMDAAPG